MNAHQSLVQGAEDIRDPLDALAAAGDPRWSFLRRRWFTASGCDQRTVVAEGADGRPLAAFGLLSRTRGPLRVAEVGGGYWPFRGVPLATHASVEDLADALSKREIAQTLGWLWRLGPVAADDPSLPRLVTAVEAAGWRALRRTLGTLFELDLAALQSAGRWPSARTQHRNRRRKRRLEEVFGAVTVRHFTGLDWTSADRNAMAAVEAASWLGQLASGGDTKFRNPQRRRFWEELCEDPVLAAMIRGSLLSVGGAPAAFAFAIQAGDTRYTIANNYAEAFAAFGPGRLLLYENFERAAHEGVTRISWGLGDAGYKSEMGAKSGPALIDLLFVRPHWLGPALAPLWRLR